VGVLVATRDRPADLARSLPAILANDYAEFRVTVVDQSRSEASRQLVERLDDHRIRYHRQAQSGLSIAQNAGLALAEPAEVYAFTDDDCRVSAGWLRRIVEVFRREADAGLVFGTLRAVPHDARSHFVPSFEPVRYRKLSGRREAFRLSPAAGANMAARAAMLRVVGGFDPCLGTGATFPSSGDTDLRRRVLRAGYAVVEDPENVVLHWGLRSHADGSAEALRAAQRRAIGALYAKELRCGHLAAGYQALRLLMGHLVLAAIPGTLAGVAPAARRARFAQCWHGFRCGLRHPLDRRAEVYQR
jgi:GT2 family glycosyltransferase